MMLFTEIVEPVATHKVCPKCEKNKPLEEFHKQPMYYSNGRKRNKHGRAVYCKVCTKEFHNPARARELALKNNFGLSEEEYQEMFAAQQGLCAVCGQPETYIHPRSGKIQPLSVDHCHVTGAVRGLLCNKCNHALGQLCEDPNIIKALLKYVEERVLY